MRRVLTGAGAAIAAAVTAAVLAAPAQAATGTYVALGDSFTAGPGIPVQDPGSGACARSDHNYPTLLAGALDPATFVDVSCSGAITDNITGPQGSAGPQLDAVPADAELVTIGIGGNDVGFGSIVGTCVALAQTDPAGRPCTEHYTSGGVDQIEETFAEKAPKIAATLRAIHTKAPQARVVLVGYLAILPAAKADCAPDNPNNAVFAEGDLPYLAGKEAALAALLGETAAANGADFVDIHSASKGHEACTAEGTRWIEGLVDVQGAAPVHPNALGMENVARLVQDSLGS
ncbi:SGNH/GDSL hydrolase family protein [Actinokineospora pegani]|uniref:SGNH/GDSL hydrolase family protein n=1 Tax=Actinokineospora pegani TaxID=2654637 RepID=UPI0018D440AE|nr:SGNH/GDSL hydrolase family protein [Actinokineospora pegani]